MKPLRRDGSAAGSVGYRAASSSFVAALAVSLVVGTLLGRSSPVTAQSVGQGTDPAFFPATGYRISSPTVLGYFQQRGGVRTFGFPISNDFELLGHHVQLFQRQLLEMRPDGSVGPLNPLDPDLLPISRIDGLTLPAADPDLLAAAPPLDSPDYTGQALAFISQYVPDTWNDLPVNFQSTYLATVTCADVFGDNPCDNSQLPALALEIWGLPTSQPTADPDNPDFVYQRFERGIMHFSSSTGLTQGLLLGDWLKRILIGTDLAPDVVAQVQGSRLYAQYAPARPLGLQRPDDLPDTTLAQAFRADGLTIAQATAEATATPTLPPSIAQTATVIAATATAVGATQVAIQATQVAATSTALVATATAVASVPSPTPTLSVVSSVPVTNVGCLGDEQMWFVPRKPFIGTHVDISVTSQRHHDIRVLRLTGPIDPGPPMERTGPFGFTWTWTIVPTFEAFWEWTFYADGLRPCITSGFNAFAPLGSTPTPTVTRQPTEIPGPPATPTVTPTATSTPVPPRPSVTSINPTHGTCNQFAQVFGQNFGNSQADRNGFVTFNGPEGNKTPSQIFSWRDTEIDLSTPANLKSGNTYRVVVSTSGGTSLENVTYFVDPPATNCTP